MSRISFELPADFAAYEWEVESKGWFSEARIVVSGKRYRLNFYDPARFRQQMEDELQRVGAFFEPNLVIVQSVTRTNMERAAVLLAQSSQVACLLEE